MSNMHDVTKRILSIQVPRELYYQLKQEAKTHKLPLAVYVRMLLSEAVLDVELTEENQQKVIKEIKNAREKRAYN